MMLATMVESLCVCTNLHVLAIVWNREFVSMLWHTGASFSLLVSLNVIINVGFCVMKQAGVFVFRYFYKSDAQMCTNIYMHSI